MSRPHSTTSRRSRRQADHASPPSRSTTGARNQNPRTRRPSVGRQHQHQLPEEDRFLNLRRSARIAHQHQDQQREPQIQRQQSHSSTMADVAHRTYARNDHGPRSVERRSTRTDYPSPTSTRSSGHSPSQYTLTVITSPSTSLTPSTTFNTRILISSRSSRRPSSPQGLLAVASLVADTPSGPQPLPAGYLMTSSPSSKLMDSVSEPSRQDLGAVARDRRDDVVGAVGFEDLCVREQGSFRVRVTLAQMTGDVYEAVAEVDSARFSVSGGGRVNGVKC